MDNIRDLKGTFSLIACMRDEDKINDMIYQAMEENLDIDDLDINECLLEIYA